MTRESWQWLGLGVLIGVALALLGVFLVVTVALISPAG